jgi:hypothetical protein
MWRHRATNKIKGFGCLLEILFFPLFLLYDEIFKVFRFEDRVAKTEKKNKEKKRMNEIINRQQQYASKQQEHYNRLKPEIEKIELEKRKRREESASLPPLVLTSEERKDRFDKFITKEVGDNFNKFSYSNLRYLGKWYKAQQLMDGFDKGDVVGQRKCNFCHNQSVVQVEYRWWVYTGSGSLDSEGESTIDLCLYCFEK